MPKTYFWGTGRRKSSVARVRLAPGEGAIVVNGKPYTEYFTRTDHRNNVTAALENTGRRLKYDVWVNVCGGGISGQAGATLLGVSRALLVAETEDEELHQTLKEHGYLTRDSRMVERKKYGQKGARAKFQFSKR